MDRRCPPNTLRRLYQGKRDGGRFEKSNFFRVEHYSLVMFSTEMGEHFNSNGNFNAHPSQRKNYGQGNTKGIVMKKIGSLKHPINAVVYYILSKEGQVVSTQ
jgi:hypothetical protein